MNLGYKFIVLLIFFSTGKNISSISDEAITELSSPVNAICLLSPLTDIKNFDASRFITLVKFSLYPTIFTDKVVLLCLLGKLLNIAIDFDIAIPDCILSITS